MMIILKNDSIVKALEFFRLKMVQDSEFIRWSSVVSHVLVFTIERYVLFCLYHSVYFVDKNFPWLLETIRHILVLQ